MKGIDFCNVGSRVGRPTRRHNGWPLVSCNLWSNVRSAALWSYAHSTEMLVKGALANVLQDCISEVGAPLHLLECEVTSSEPILHPEVGHVQVTHATEPLPSADADGSARVCSKVKLPVKPEVSRDGLQAQSCGCSGNDPSELCLRGAKADCGLRTRVASDAVLPSQGHSGARRAPRGGTSCEVGVSEHRQHACIRVLPLECPHEAWTPH